MTKRLNLLELKHLLDKIDARTLGMMSICADLGVEDPDGKITLCWHGKGDDDENIANDFYETNEYYKLYEGLCQFLTEDAKKISIFQLADENIKERLSEEYEENEMKW